MPPSRQEESDLPFTGKCHLCALQVDDLKFCGLCGHWMCGDCRTRFFHRGYAAVKALLDAVLGKDGEVCCGP